MSYTGAVPRSTDSRSLWNFTQSPGWSEEESNVLRLAIMRYGVGSWSKIVENEVLPGKSMAQIVLQAQRMLGQQSIREFFGIRLDPQEIRKNNEERMECEAVRLKNGIIVNDGAYPTKEALQEKWEENSRQYGIDEDKACDLVKPEDLFALKKKHYASLRKDLAKRCLKDLTVEDKELLLKMLKERVGEMQTLAFGESDPGKKETKNDTDAKSTEPATSLSKAPAAKKRRKR